MNPHTGVPRQPVKRSISQLLPHILQPSYNNYISTTGLFYEILELPLSELETKKLLKVTWLPDGISCSETFDLLVPKNGQVQDLKEELQKRLELDGAAMGRIRLFESHSGKFLKILTNDLAVPGTEYVDFFAERVPEDELSLEEGDRHVTAFHFHKEPVKVHARGIPFRFVVKNVRISVISIHFVHSTNSHKGEIFKQTKERLQKRTGLKGKPFEKIKFAVVKKAQFSKPIYLEDGEYSTICW